MLELGGVLIGLVLLFFGGNWLVEGASRLARSLGISPLVVGLTVVALGTSAPELLVSLSAALSGSSDIAVGNVVGSNIANIGLILGISGLIYPISVHVDLLKREIPIMLVASVVAVIMFQDGQIGRLDGIILVAGLIAFISFMVVSALRDRRIQPDPVEEQRLHPVNVNRTTEMLRFALGLIVLAVGAQITVGNATQLARSLGVSELVIGITLISIGTSLPELVTSIIAALSKNSDIAIGNVVGSNIFNLLAILGITAVVRPINVSPQIAGGEALMMLGFSFLLLPFVINRVLGRRESMIFLAAYVVFTIYAVTIAG
ncbi:MAG: calcium/sodium antiporter [Anaerolineaceae bacterium]|nr:calcium/sodium antiporter [Anaerolineaceae bacterium]